MSSRAPAPDLAARVSRLTAREREALRLLLRGHDAKSGARLLGLSPTGFNERLRDARRRLGVSSSREAARLLAAVEGAPEFLVDEPFGLHGPARLRSPQSPAQRRLAVSLGGGLMTFGIITGGLALWATTGLGVGNEAASRSGPAPPPAAAPPRVIRTTPAQSATIAPGPFLLSVTFDQAMEKGSYSFVQVAPETFPDCEHQASQSPDGHTYSMRCTAKPGRHYETWFNNPPYMNFKSPAGPPAKPYQLLFQSSSH